MALPLALIALPGRSITQFTVLPVAFAAEPAILDSPERTLPAKPRGSGSGGGALVVTVLAEAAAPYGAAGGGGPRRIGPAAGAAPGGGGRLPDTDATAGGAGAAAAAGASGRGRAIGGRAAGKGAEAMA